MNVFLLIIFSFFQIDKVMGCEIVTETEKPEILSFLNENLAKESTVLRNTTPVSEIILKYTDNDKNIIGATVGYIFYGSLLIDMLWVEYKHRKKGVGKKLLKKLEDIAISKGARFATVTSMDWWDAKNFYEKQGYKLEFTRHGYQNNSTQYSYIKFF